MKVNNTQKIYYINKDTPVIISTFQDLNYIYIYDNINTIFNKKKLDLYLKENKNFFNEFKLSLYEKKLVILLNSSWDIYRNGEDKLIEELKPYTSYLTFAKLNFLKLDDKILNRLFKKRVLEYIDNKIICHVVIQTDTLNFHDFIANLK